MKYEIERKFLVCDKSIINDLTGSLCRQAYIETAKNNVVRVRVFGKLACITLKGESKGSKRLEYEYEIPIKDANEIMDNLCEKPIIEKIRYSVYYKGNTWIIDEFKGKNDGLVIAEIELEKEEDSFEKPEWVGEEVTNDIRYFNSNLVKKPYINWNN